jgi:uncharacterized SAM-binding protein YcdF (DUF218 family)
MKPPRGESAARPAGRRRPGPVRWPPLLASLLALDLLATGAYLRWGELTLPAPIPQRAHAAGVLFFADFGDGRPLGPRSLERVDHAARLYRLKRVQELICVGGRRAAREHGGASLMAEALAARGVPAERITPDHNSFDTISNWRSARALLAPDAAADPLLISAPLHLLRIRHITGGIGTPAPTKRIADALRQRPLATWRDVHREWLAWAAMALLPAERHRRWIRYWRDFWD